MRKTLLALVLLFAIMGSCVAARPQSKESKQTPEIGMEKGQKAPAFALIDQFGHEQSNESLRGKNGTVLLFVRSADW